MSSLSFTATDGVNYDVDAPIGQTVMMAALNHDVPGIEGECGGDMACGTCHAYVDTNWLDRLHAPSADEAEMPNVLVEDPRSTSRLGCQMRVTADCDGLRVVVAGS